MIAIQKHFSCIYNPSRNNSIDNYFNAISNLLIDFDFFNICGDLDINLLTNDHKSVELKNHFASADFSLVNNLLPARFGNKVKPSLLDILAVSEPSEVLQ